MRGDPDALREQIATHKCASGSVKNGCQAAEPVTIEIERGGEPRTFEASPVYDAENEAAAARLRVPLRPARRSGRCGAARLSVDQMWVFTRETVTTIAQIFKAEKRKEISGVVGTYEVTRQSIDLGWERGFFLLAVISLSLGVINLFPFLPLDGGHIFWALAEKVRGRPIAFSVMERAGFIGFALVIGLFFIGFTNDVGRLTGEGFNVR